MLTYEAEHLEQLDLFGQPVLENVLGEPVFEVEAEPLESESTITDEVTDFSLYGYNLFGEPVNPEPRGAVAGKFTLPPFSVLNTTEGFWQERKRNWLSLGIRSEVGRDDALTYQSSEGSFFQSVVQQRGGGTSIFDPVLTELLYDWFCPRGGQVVDPFAGGSVRGIVAACLGRSYWGCDLSAAQVAANIEQGADIVPLNQPTWVQGNSDLMLECAPDADFIFSCPPYGDLEVYSDDPSDLSNMPYAQMLISYESIIRKAVAKLRPNRFACFVVSEFRDPRGHYRGFVPDTIRAFEDAGAHFYNEAILVNSCGSLPVRITKQFESGRKMGRRHQNVLVFVKGDSKLATKAVLDAGAE